MESSAGPLPRGKRHERSGNVALDLAIAHCILRHNRELCRLERARSRKYHRLSVSAEWRHRAKAIIDINLAKHRPSTRAKILLLTYELAHRALFQPAGAARLSLNLVEAIYGSQVRRGTQWILNRSGLFDLVASQSFAPDGEDQYRHQGKLKPLPERRSRSYRPAGVKLTPINPTCNTESAKNPIKQRVRKRLYTPPGEVDGSSAPGVRQFWDLGCDAGLVLVRTEDWDRFVELRQGGMEELGWLKSQEIVEKNLRLLHCVSIQLTKNGR